MDIFEYFHINNSGLAKPHMCKSEELTQPLKPLTQNP